MVGEVDPDQILQESYDFFKYLVGELRNWKRSRFGDCLQRDLSKLPASKRAEYLEGLENMQGVPQWINSKMIE